MSTAELFALYIALGKAADEEWVSPLEERAIADLRAAVGGELRDLGVEVLP